MAANHPITDYSVTTSSGMIAKKRGRSELQHGNGIEGITGSPPPTSDTIIKNLGILRVEELRSKLRSIGLPAKGCKSDLISALKCFFMKETPSLASEVKCDVLPCERNAISLTSNESWTLLSHKKPQKEWASYNPIVMRAPPLPPHTKYMKLMSWNVNGIRALLKKRDFSGLELPKAEGDFDVLCLQETKLQEKDVQDIKKCFSNGYEHNYWTCSVSKLGYSGTAIISRIKPISVRYGLGIADHDSEGRLLTAEFETFFLLNAYVPNSGDGLKRLSYRITQWDPSLSSYMKELEKSKPVILTGDLNCAHEEIDIYNPAANRRSAGFTDEERGSFGSSFLEKGFVDTFRNQHPNVIGYTYWGYRHSARKANKGWRLDYFLASVGMRERIHDSYILPHVTGSDHCPIGLLLKL